jgi:hypothetical protein
VTLSFNSAGVTAPFGGSITSGQTYFLYSLDPSAVPLQLLASYLPADGPGLVIEGVPPDTYTVPLGSFASATALHFGVYSTVGDFWQYTAHLVPTTSPTAVRFEARHPITDAAGFFAIDLTGIEGFSGVIGVVPEPSTAALLVIGLLGVAGYARARPD